MKIVNVGYNFKHPKVFSINRPFGSGDYILLVVRTPAFFILNQEKQVINSNCIVVYKKGTPQIYGATEDEYINDWIHFEADENDIKMIKIGT